MKDSTYIFLNSIRAIDKKIERLQSKKQQLEWSLLPAGIRYDKDRVQTTPEDSMLAICTDIAEVDTEITMLMMKRAEQVKTVYDTIEKMQDMDEQTVIIQRYIMRTPIKDIAKTACYSVEWVQKKRKDGVDHLTEILEGVKE